MPAAKDFFRIKKIAKSISLNRINQRLNQLTTLHTDNDLPGNLVQAANESDDFSQYRRFVFADKISLQVRLFIHLTG